MKDIIISIAMLFIGLSLWVAVTAERKGDEFVVDIEELTAQVKEFQDSLGAFQDGLIVQSGKASWYGEPFHGRLTANGETYDMYKISAAHKTLRLGTWVRVENLENERVLDIRLNDRGPFVKGRIIDLSFGAAKKLGMIKAGVVDVKLIAIKG